MNNFPLDVCVAGPPEYIHSEAFREVAETVHWGLQELGFDSKFKFSTFDFSTKDRRSVIFGGHTLSLFRKFVPADSIIYNLEMIPEPDFDENGNPFTPAKWANCMGGKPLYISILKTASAIWDYSLHNIANMRKYGITAPMFHMPICYYPGLARVDRKENPEYDVVYVGSQNPRREKVMAELQKKGFKAHSRFSLYGKDRDDFLGQGKIHLNSHFYDTNLLETVRTCYLLANHCFVVSEHGSCPHEDAEWEGGIVFSSYEKLAETCEAWLARSQSKRDDVASFGNHLMRCRRVETELHQVFQRMRRAGAL